MNALNGSIFRHQMVNFAILNGGVVYALQVDRRTHSNLRVDAPYTCFGCKHPLIHKSGDKIVAHFAHKHTDCEHCKDCEYFAGKIFEPSTYKELEMGFDFVQKWQNGRPYFADTKEGRIYNHGSEKAKITIFDDVRDKESKRIIENINPPRVVILNAECLGLELYLTNDSCQYWVRFQNKSFIDDILHKKAIVLIDTGSPLLLRLNSLHKLESANYDGEDGENPKYLNQCYPCAYIDVATAIIEYFPDDYTFSIELYGEPVKPNILHNNIERKKQEEKKEREQAEIRLAQKTFAEEEMKKRLDSKSRTREEREEYSRVASVRQVIYKPRNLHNKYEVKELYKKYLSEYDFVDTNAVLDFTREVANDGTDFIDISSLNIPSDKKCSYKAYLVLKEITGFLTKYTEV